MDKQLVFMFSGQGSQYFHMGRELFEHNSVFHKWMGVLDDIVRRISGESVLGHVYDNNKSRNEPFEHILFSHPAIFMVEYALAQVFREEGLEPDVVLGSSLGEYTAAALAGIMGPEDVLRLVVKQAELIEANCEKGGMLAILHDVRLFNDEPLLHDNTELAAVNFESHFVLAGGKKQIEEVARYLKSRNILCQTLPVAYGFHSAGIDRAGPAFISYLRPQAYSPARISFLSCRYAMFLENIPENYLWDVVRNSMQFPRAIQELERSQGCVYIDLGPGGTLANFAKRNITNGSRSEIYSVMTQFNQDVKNLERILGLFRTKHHGSAGRKEST